MSKMELEVAGEQLIGGSNGNGAVRGTKINLAIACKAAVGLWLNHDMSEALEELDRLVTANKWKQDPETKKLMAQRATVDACLIATEMESKLRCAEKCKAGDLESMLPAQMEQDAIDG
jgi:hypothetical protein